MDDTNSAGAAKAVSANGETCAARACPDCGKLVSRNSRSGYCHPHMLSRRNRDPEVRRRISETRRLHFSRPGTREALSEAVRRGMADLAPEERERRRARGKAAVRDVLFRPDVRARTMAPEVRRKAGVARTESTIGWCPPHLRDSYRQLVNAKHIPAADARRMIEAAAAKEERERLAAMTPFERQMERVANGAQLVTKSMRPAAEPAFTLGGVSAGLL